MPGSAAFISYSREDSEFALRLAQDLKAAGANVWLDQLELIPGHAWDNAIEDALLGAPQMLVVLSPTSVRSENVRDEISYALKQGKTVIPVLYMECVIPLRLERKQHIDFRSDYAQGLAHLLKCLDVVRPDPAVLKKAAEGDAQRQAAWQAREVEAQRLRELAEREREDTERKANEELSRRQEADARAAEELRQKQAAEREAQEQAKLREREAEAVRIAEERRKEEARKAELAAEAKARPDPVAQPARAQAIQPPAPQIVPEQHTGARKLPVWAWATLAAVVLVAVFVAGRFLAPQPSPAPTPTSQPQPAASQTPPAPSPAVPDVAAKTPGSAPAPANKPSVPAPPASKPAAAGSPFQDPKYGWLPDTEQQRQQQAAAEQQRQQQIAEQQRQQQAAAEAAAEQQRQQQESSVTWADPATGLMWTKKDNGSNVTWQQAMDYCQNLQLGGHSDWRLATIDELQGIYDPSVNVPSAGGPSAYTYSVKGNLQLSHKWQWSSTLGNSAGDPGYAWFFMFFRYGGKAAHRIEQGESHRALCVRRSGG